jgi:hypothetical protein
MEAAKKIKVGKNGERLKPNSSVCVRMQPAAKNRKTRDRKVQGRTWQTIVGGDYLYKLLGSDWQRG